MPTTSIGYINGRISVKRRERLTGAGLDRLEAAAGYEEALRILSEIGWASGDATAMDYERIAAQHMQETCTFVRDNTPDANVTDCFLLRYDMENLKLLLKARTLTVTVDQLSSCGIFDLDQLRHAVNEGVYRILPTALSEPLDALEKRLAVRVDAMDIDVTLDRAMYALIFEKLRNVRSGPVRAYFVAQVDTLNALALLRFQKMRRDAVDYEHVFLAGGSISLAELTGVYDEPERLHQLYGRYGRKIEEAVQRAQSEGALAALEKTADDYGLALFTPYKFQPGRLEAVVGYLLAQMREVAAVRLVMAARYNHFAPEQVAERLRDLHG